MCFPTDLQVLYKAGITTQTILWRIDKGVLKVIGARQSSDLNKRYPIKLENKGKNFSSENFALLHSVINLLTVPIAEEWSNFRMTVMPAAIGRDAVDTSAHP